MSDEEKAIEMFVGGLLLDQNTEAPVVVLKDESDKVHLPIWIGMAEATSIASAIKQLNMGRPLTHDLMIAIFEEIGVVLQRILITDLKDSTYFSELVLSYGDKAMILDARPSDAIALAVRTQSPIFVAQKVLDKAQVAFDKESKAAKKKTADSGEKLPEEEESLEGINTANFKDIDKEQWSEILEDLDEEDFKYKM